MWRHKRRVTVFVTTQLPSLSRNINSPLIKTLHLNELIFHLDGIQTSQITSNSNWKPLTRSKDFLENLTLKVLCDVIPLSLPCQSEIPCFKMSSYQLDEYLLKPNFSNHIKIKHLSEDFNLKVLCDIIFPLLPDKTHSSCFTKQIFNEMSPSGRQTFQIMQNWNKNLYQHPKTYCKK